MQARMVRSKSWAKVGWPEKMAVGPQILNNVPGACAHVPIRLVQKDVDASTIPLADALGQVSSVPFELR